MHLSQGGIKDLRKEQAGKLAQKGKNEKIMMCGKKRYCVKKREMDWCSCNL